MKLLLLLLLPVTMFGQVIDSGKSWRNTLLTVTSDSNGYYMLKDSTFIFNDSTYYGGKWDSRIYLKDTPRRKQYLGGRLVAVQSEVVDSSDIWVLNKKDEWVKIPRSRKMYRGDGYDNPNRKIKDTAYNYPVIGSNDGIVRPIKLDTASFFGEAIKPRRIYVLRDVGDSVWLYDLDNATKTFLHIAAKPKQKTNWLSYILMGAGFFIALFIMYIISLFFKKKPR